MLYSFINVTVHNPTVERISSAKPARLEVELQATTAMWAGVLKDSYLLKKSLCNA